MSPGQQAYEVLPPSGATADRHAVRRGPRVGRPVDPVGDAGAPAGWRDDHHCRRADAHAASHPAARRRRRAASSRAWCTPSNSGVDARGEPAPGTRRSDAEAVARAPRPEPGGAFTVVVRGDDGTPGGHRQRALPPRRHPMPTGTGSVDPELRTVVGRLEAAGGVREAEARGGRGGPRLHCHRRTPRAGRADPVTGRGRRPSGGVGGTRQGRQVPARPRGLVAGGRGRRGRRLGGGRSSG